MLFSSLARIFESVQAPSRATRCGASEKRPSHDSSIEPNAHLRFLHPRREWGRGNAVHNGTRLA